MAHLTDFTQNLCSTCTMDISYCPANLEDVDYGTGSDNIVQCPFYDPSPHVASSAEVIEDIAKAHA